MTEFRVLHLVLVRPTALCFLYLFRFFCLLFLFNLNIVLFIEEIDIFYLLKENIVIVSRCCSQRRCWYSFLYRVLYMRCRKYSFCLSSRGIFEVLIYLYWSYRGEKNHYSKNHATMIWFIESVVWVRIRRCTLNTVTHFFFYWALLCLVHCFFFFIVCRVMCCVSQLACVVIWIVFSRRISS